MEALRKSTIKEFALELRSEFMTYDFNLSSSYCDSNDVMIALDTFINNRPIIWTEFIQHLFSGRNIDENENPSLQTKIDYFFQFHLFFLNY